MRKSSFTREAVAKLQRDAGEHLDDDATLLLLARHVLGGPVDEGGASYLSAGRLRKLSAR